jgi:hypothetical protein
MHLPGDGTNPCACSSTYDRTAQTAAEERSQHRATSGSDSRSLARPDSTLVVAAMVIAPIVISAVAIPAIVITGITIPAIAITAIVIPAIAIAAIVIPAIAILMATVVLPAIIPTSAVIVPAAATLAGTLVKIIIVAIPLIMMLRHDRRARSHRQRSRKCADSQGLNTPLYLLFHALPLRPGGSPRTRYLKRGPATTESSRYAYAVSPYPVQMPSRSAG